MSESYKFTIVVRNYNNHTVHELTTWFKEQGIPFDRVWQKEYSTFVDFHVPERYNTEVVCRMEHALDDTGLVKIAKPRSRNLIDKYAAQSKEKAVTVKKEKKKQRSRDLQMAKQVRDWFNQGYLKDYRYCDILQTLKVNPEDIDDE